jgi:hypothetical protein
MGREKVRDTMSVVPEYAYDLTYDPNEVGADLVVECRLRRGPRASDPTFDPSPGDTVRIGDDEEAPLEARVIRRAGDRVWVQVQLPAQAPAVA